MSKQTAGIHHITAFARNAQENIDFYTGILGLRLVKKTVNFDAPEVYHFYFGNEVGSPGTIMTFFPWETGRKGQVGGGQVGVTTFVVPEGALDYWKTRLKQFQISVTEAERFGEGYLQFADHDGLPLEITARAEGPDSEWVSEGIPVEKAIKGFGGAVLYSTYPDHTAVTLEHVMGLEKIASDDTWVRFKGSGELGQVIDMKASAVPQGHGGYGTVHHIAWRAQDDEDHKAWKQYVERNGFEATPIIDRQYFNAIYFREGGGILFEIATDPPGFTVDESIDALGSELKLPPQYEPHREQINQMLPPIELHSVEGTKQ